MRSSNWLIFLFILSCCFFVSNFLNTFASPTRHLCLPDQKDALLDFKNEFRIQKQNDFSSLCNPKTKSWKNNDDCCYWDGVTCDAKSGEVIELDLSFNCLTGVFKPNSSLFRLQHLRSLNLAFNNFSSSSIPAEFSKLIRLTQLDLFYSSFSGQIPTELLQLTKLVSLDLSTSPFYPDLFTNEPFLSKLATNLTNLRELHLSYINISSTVPKKFVNLSSLRSLSLDGCNLFGEFPREVFVLPQIQSISLFNNANLKVSLPNFLTNSSLETLNLSNTTSSGKLPDSIGNLKSLNVLKVSSCNFTGRIPSSLGNLSNLIILDLSSNSFIGEVPSSIGNLNGLIGLELSGNQLSGTFSLVLLNLTELSFITLSDNQFIGTLPSDMSCLSKLEYFLGNGNSFIGTLPSSLFAIPSLIAVDLSENQFGGPLEFGNVSSSSKLETLFLGDNNFSGSIPRSISKLVNLKKLSLSNLNMSGSVDLSIFSHLGSLEMLDLSGNNVFVEYVSSTSDFPLHLEELQLSTCNINEFPEFLRTQRDLLSLDLSNNKIKGQIPEWLWRLPKLEFVYLSYNSLNSFEGSPEALRATNIRMIDLHSNAFRGPFPVPPLSISHLVGSENNFSGELPRSLCKLKSLEVLDLSNNHFSGSIPGCLGHSSNSLSILNLGNNNLSGLIPRCFRNSLSVLNLRNNNLGGMLPEAFSKGSKLRTLDVGHNRLVGKIPRSLINCASLEILNVESNRINDTFPFWLETLPELQVLVLRSNEFYGPMYLPRVSLGFPKLRIIDISHNDFMGTLPSDYFANWTAMLSLKTNHDHSKLKYMGDSRGYYQDSIVLMNKGLEMELVRILTIYTAIDFSGNRLRGQIPESIGLLKELIVLNLSNNAFTCHIPPSLANVTELESLDLSQNKLSGKIPPELGNLSFLGYINLSHNQFIGPIPQGTQFQRQPSSSFKGNPGLYGSPLQENVDIPTPKETQQMEPEEEVLSWIAAGIGYAPGLVFGLVIGHIVTSHTHEWFMKIFGRDWRRRARTH